MDNISLSTILFSVSFILLSSVISVINQNKPYIQINEDWKYPSLYELRLIALDYKKKSKINLYFGDFEDCYKLDAAINNYINAKKSYEKTEDFTISHCYFSYLILIVSWLCTETNKTNWWIMLIVIALTIVVSIIVYKLIKRFYSGNYKYIEFSWNKEDDAPLSPDDYAKCTAYFKAEKERCMDRIERRAKVYNDAAYYMKYAHSKKIILAGIAFSLIYLLSNFLIA